MLRFNIRDVLWLTVVVALVVGWCVDRYRVAENERTLQAQQDALRANQAALDKELSALRMELLWEKELRGEIILTPSPGRSLR